MLDSKQTKSSNIFSNFLSSPLIWTLFTLSMLLTLAISYRFHSEHEARSIEHFIDASKQVVSIVEEQIIDHKEIIQSGVAYYNASEYVTQDEWNTFVNQMQTVQKYPALKSIKLLRLNASDTTIALSNPSMKDSMERSKDMGKTVLATSPDGSVTYITIPMYHKLQPQSALPQKRDVHIGWVMGIINTHELFTPVRGSKIHHLDFKISHTDNRPIFTTLTSSASPAKHHQKMPLTILGTILQIDTYSTPISLAKIHLDVSGYVLLSGLFLNILLLIILLSFNAKRTALEIKNIELDMLNTLIDESNDMVLIIRMNDSYIEYINQTTIKMLGYTLEEIRTIGIEGFRRPLKEGELFMEHLKELKKMGRLTDYAIVTRKDGSEFPVEANVRMVRYNGVDYNIAVVRDISENELYTQKLNVITKHLNEAQKIAKLGSWCLTLDTGALEWSDEIYELFEIDPESHNPSYEGFLNAIHPEDRDLVNAAYIHSVEHHTSYNYVHRLLMADGRVKYVREQGENFYDFDGQPQQSRGTVHDITDEILLQERLKEKNTQLLEASARLELATHAAGIGIWIWNLTDNSLIWDPQMYKLYDAQKHQNQLIQPYEFWKSYCHPDDVDSIEASLQHAIHDNIPLDTSFRIFDTSGQEKHLQATAIVKRDANNIPIYMIGINRDITAEKKLTDSLTVSREIAERANQAKSDFLANMSHEIRTPLNGVIGLTELLLQTQLQPLQREYLNKSETAAKALLSVLNNILDYSKIEAHKMTLEATAFNLDDIMTNLHAMLSYKAEQKNLSFESHIDDTVPRALIGDPLRLQQILSNLVVNALKFTDSGFVRISVTSTTQKDHNKLTFAISDSGIGMNPQEQTALFQPFSQVDTSFTRKYGGSGLGLMITKELVELMGGQITVHSVSGEGSTFTFTALFDHSPMFLSELTQKAVLPEEHALPNQKPLHLLLVEDNDLNQLVASERLKQMGITCSIANNGLEAVEMVQHEKFDAILMDLQMPVMDGLEATRQIRKLPEFADIPIIALSAAVLQDDLSMAMEAGMNDHISKPIDKIAFQKILSKWLHV